MKCWIIEKAGREIPALISDDISSHAFSELNVVREIPIFLGEANLIVMSDSSEDRETIETLLAGGVVVY